MTKEVISLENTFQALKDEKKKRIINSALQEFSLNNYEKASTNNIVKNAGISKGSLFQYFANKQAIYDYLERFAIEVMLEAIKEQMDFVEKDLFVRIRQIAMIKLGVAKEYPYIIAFSKVIYERRTIEEMKERVIAKDPHIYQKIYYENVDFGLFREDMDVQQMIQITMWVVEKISEEYLRKIIGTDQVPDVDALVSEVDQYLITLKLAFYK